MIMRKKREGGRVFQSCFKVQHFLFFCGHHHVNIFIDRDREKLLLLYPKAESFPWCWLPQIHCCMVAWSERGLTVHLASAGAWSDTVVGNPLAARVDLHPASLRGRPVFMCSSSVESRVPQPFRLSKQSRVLLSSTKTPGLGAQPVAKHTCSPCSFSFPEFLPRSTSPYPVTFLSFLLTCLSSLQLWLYSPFFSF